MTYKTRPLVSAPSHTSIGPVRAALSSFPAGHRKRVHDPRRLIARLIRVEGRKGIPGDFFGFDCDSEEPLVGVVVRERLRLITCR